MSATVTFKKKFCTLLITTTFISFLFSAQETYAASYTYGGFKFKSGDILITQNTISSDIVGHAAIVSPTAKYTISTDGKGKKPSEHKLSTWLKTYKSSTKVVRYKSNSNALKAANWAYSHYATGPYRNASYSLADSLYSFKKTYCSKIVWQSYYYGSGVTFKLWETHEPYQRYVPYTWTPYDFLNNYLGNMGKNGLKTVKTFGWR